MQRAALAHALRPHAAMPRVRHGNLLAALAVIAVLGGILAAASTQGGALPGPLPLFPPDNWWNLDISNAPVDPASASYITFIGPTRRAHPDFGGDVSPGSIQNYGFPYAVVDGALPLKAVQFQYSDESDGVNHTTDQSFPFYPIPDEAITQAHWIEGGDPGNVDLRSSSDRHLLIVDRDRRHLFELYNVFYDGIQWHAGSGAFFDLNANGRRPDGWTSADAAGLAILPGLVRYDEVFGTGEINHAFRVTVRSTNGYVYPASHRAGSTNGALPMGARLRLKASKNLSGFTPEVQKIFRAMQRHGLIVADNGSDLYVSGTYDNRWDNGVLNPAFHSLIGSDFEVITLGYQPTTPSITTQPANQTVAPGQNAQITLVATGALSYQWQVSTNSGATWTNVSNTPPYSGATTATLAITSATTGLNGSWYRCVATNSSGSATSNAATLTVGPTMTLDHPALAYGAVTTGGTLSHITAAQTVRVAFIGAAPTWVAVPTVPASEVPWLQITGGSGTGNGQFTVGVVSAVGLPATGTVTATIQVVSGGAVNSPQLVTVRLTLFPATTTTTAPFGSFDTPVAGGVQGSVAVTGWALDDIEVERVEIWRDLAVGETTVPFSGPGHPGHGKVFIANALFVPGARPDVEAAYGSNPFAYRAGWGYLMLTWGLWNQGNGAFTLYAFAFDKEGKPTTLGTKAITATNATATRPFGGIDTPTYGQTVTTSFWNYGWALTPNPNSADMRSCTIANGNVSVAIDSGPLIPVTYGGARTDIASAFPGVSNANNAGGAYYIDISTLANGTHSIGWYVVDNCGRADGVGSRFFTVAKSSLTPADVPNADPRLRGIRLQADSHGLPETIRLKPDPTIRLATDGVHIVEIDQSERLELPLAASDGVYTGAQIVRGEQRALPLGSSLDADRGIFYWQPAAGFLGRFDLEFVRSVRLQADPAVRGIRLQPDYESQPETIRLKADPTNGNVPEKIRLKPDPTTRVRIVVGPPLRMAIDAPQPGAIAHQPFFVAGWALDLATIDGSGIDTVHVWAYPATGAAPIFLGVANVGDARPDVAVAYGAEFERSSYALISTGLSPGTYDVVVYAHRTSTGTFEGARSARVIVP